MIKPPFVLGISASHNGAACLMQGGRIVAAIQEERLAGKKRAKLFGARPSLAVQYCLDEAGISPADLDMVVVCAQTSVHGPEHEITLNPQLNVKANRTRTAFISHHAGHAISAYATSGFRDAVVLVVDGMGSPTFDLSRDEQLAVLDAGGVGGETSSIYMAQGARLKALEKHMVADGRWLGPPPPGCAMQTFGSLGGIFSAAADLIFGNAMDAGKVMGLAPYGKPLIPPEEFFTIQDGRFEFHDHVPRRFTRADRWPANQADYENLAASVQNALEHALLYLAGRARELCPGRNLVYAGGVALNSVANERIIRECGFEHVYVMPAAEDSGPAIGAAYYGSWQLDVRPAPAALRRDGFGHTYNRDEIDAAISRTPSIVTEQPADTIRAAAGLLDAGKIIAFFTGPSELGPRALGQRSILCDPRRADAKALLNARVKHREGFRPFAPVVPLEAVQDWFEVDGVDPASPFMLRVMRFKPERRDQVPAVVHVDGTGRVQTVTREDNGRYYDLVRAFGERTGVPMLLNTSLNVMGEPIVETPEDALWCLMLTQLDACVFDHVIVTRRPGYGSLTELYPRFIVEPSRVQQAPDGKGLLFSIDTPWGLHRFGIGDPATVNILGLLAGGLMDGSTRADTIFARLRERLGDTPDSFLIRLFAHLRRWRVIAFSDTPVAGRATAPAATAAVQVDTPDAARGLQYLMGTGVAADPARGIAMIEQAAAAGDAQAAWLASTIAASEFWRPADWGKALAYLADAASRDHGPAQQSLRILAGGPAGQPSDGTNWRYLSRSVDLHAWRMPPAGALLRESPRLLTFERFIPVPVCEWLINQARDGLTRATIYDKATGGTTEDGRRTNSECDLGIDRCGMLSFVVRARIGAATGKRDTDMEVPKVLHYAPGETFANHFDFLNPDEPAYQAQLAARGQRTHTILIYLNDNYSEGETHFPRLDLKNRGARGDAFLFANVDTRGAPDYLTMHAGLPPGSGEKWLFSQWIRGKQQEG